MGGMAKDTEALALKFGTSFVGKSKGKPPRALEAKAKPKMKAVTKKAAKPVKAKRATKAGAAKKAAEKGKKKGIPKTSVKKISGKTRKRKPKKKAGKGKVQTFDLIPKCLNQLSHECVHKITYTSYQELHFQYYP